jgi:hypothetical protein
MKKINTVFAFVLYMGFIGFTGCISEGNSNPAMPETLQAGATAEKQTEIEWIDTNKVVENIEEGQKVEVVFRFKNIGENPLVIKNVSASCGCTVPERPDKPVMPGQMGFIKGVFDSKGRPGENHKTIFVDANTNQSMSYNLEFTVKVNPKKA